MRVSSMLLIIYSKIKLFMLAFTIIASYANRNYIKAKIAKKLFNVKFKFDFKDILNLYDLKLRFNNH